eukprot:COSAG03_NODE_110_length_12523_cov_61.863731_13_plen_204_part_00
MRALCSSCTHVLARHTQLRPRGVRGVNTRRSSVNSLKPPLVDWMASTSAGSFRGDTINGATLGRMADSSAAEPIAVLGERLRRDGYLLLRGLLPRAAVDAGRWRIASELESAGWLVPGSKADTLTVDVANLVWDSAHPPSNIGGQPTQEFLRLPELARVLAAPELEAFFTRLFGEPSACFDFKWFRAIRPGSGQGFHCDNICK